MFSVYILPQLQGLREEWGLSYSYNLYFRMRRQRTDRQRRARKDARMKRYRQNARDEPARSPEDDGARRRWSRRKCIPIIILIVAIIAGGITVSFLVFPGKAKADTTVSTDSETCSDEWFE